MVLPDTSVWIEYLRADAPKPDRSRGQPPNRGAPRERRGDNPADPAAQQDEADGLSLADELDRLIEQQQVLTCGPVVAELIAGARGSQGESLAAQFAAQPWIELKRSDWLRVGETAAKLRERGETVPLIDIQIAVCAVNGDAQLWTRDGDFERVAGVLDGLRLRMHDGAT